MRSEGVLLCRFCPIMVYLRGAIGSSELLKSRKRFVGSVAALLRLLSFEQMLL
jgi:hypothetical protein